MNAGGAEDHFGRLRAELDGIQIGERLGCVCDLDSWEPGKKKAKKKKNSNKKKANKKKAS